jgi:hypothetical protein
MNYSRSLTQAQIEEARELRIKYHWTKRRLAQYFVVGETTMWDNVFRKGSRKKRRSQTWITKPKVCLPCSKCEICMTKEFYDTQIPVNYQIRDKCVDCYLKSQGLGYIALLNIET